MGPVLKINSLDGRHESLGWASFNQYGLIFENLNTWVAQYTVN